MFFIILFMVQYFVQIQCENNIFASVSDLEDLLDIQYILVNNVKLFTNELKNKIYVLKSYLDQLKTKEINDTDANLIDNFLTIRRFVKIWPNVEKVVLIDNGKVFVDEIATHASNYLAPTGNDIKGVAQGIARLQETYQLNSSYLASGELEFSLTLSAHDCFEIGRELYHTHYFFYSKQWMIEANGRIKDNSQSSLFLRANIYNYLLQFFKKEGNFTAALDIANKLLEFYPNDTRFLDDQSSCKEKINSGIIENETLLNEDSDEDHNWTPRNLPTPPWSYFKKINDHYQKLCRSQFKQNLRKSSKLYCRFVTNNSAFLKIAPLKLEEISIDPWVVIYHNVIYNSEIEVFKYMSQPYLERSHVGGFGKIETNEHRTSKTAWMRNDDHKFVYELSLRTEDMTGLSTKYSDEFQIVNYGIGGHYIPHFDFFRKNDSSLENFPNGNRLATVLFYVVTFNLKKMSNVTNSGATVFPFLDIAIWPEKGSAVVWYNLYKSGVGNFWTRHGSCPILIGSKWICNKWIMDKGNEFKYQCSTNPDGPMEYQNLFH